MIPRYQRILYWLLVVSIVLMSVALVISKRRDQQRILAMRDRSPIPAPTDIPDEDASVALANDADDTVTLDQISLALPAEPSLRARVLLDRMLTDLSLPASTHPIPPGPAVTDVFFLALPIRNPAATITDAPADQASEPAATALTGVPGIQLAVVNLTKAFADAHPSGIESEDLTLRAIIATLHANFSQIAQVRFLIDGQPRDTLAGHADLTRAYGVSEPEKSIHEVEGSGIRD
jgi:hypothetical protein